MEVTHYTQQSSNTFVIKLVLFSAGAQRWSERNKVSLQEYQTIWYKEKRSNVERKSGRYNKCKASGYKTSTAKAINILKRREDHMGDKHNVVTKE